MGRAGGDVVAQAAVVGGSGSTGLAVGGRGAVYDAAGHLLHQLRASEVHDQGLGGQGGTLMSDVRVRYADLRQPQVPYTVEFDYEEVSDNPLFYPTWQPQSQAGLALQSASLRVSTPAALPLRYQERQLPPGTATVRTATAALATHQWQLADLPALEDEDAAPPLAALAPGVALAPGAFAVQGHAGTAATWAGLGQWNYALNAGRDALPPAAAAAVRAAVAGAADDRARVRRVYALLQGSTRYVSVQLGLGGWQTLPATAVASTGYGDCKALTNYTKALLNAAGIPAFAALVAAGAEAADVPLDFPNAGFNHVILCVPPTRNGLADTLWLECTSQTTACGYVGSFAGNRHALLLMPQGGQLVATPRYGAAENRQERRLDLFLDAAGNATATVRTRRTGLAQEPYAGLLHALSAAEQKQYLADHLPLPTFTLTQCALAPEPGGPVPALLETLALTLPGLAPATGRRCFLAPNLLGYLPALPVAAAASRRAALWLPAAQHFADTVLVHLPASLRPETLPAPVAWRTPYGHYASQYAALPDGTVQYVRHLELRSGHLPAAAYAAYVAFCRRINQADKAPLVLLNTER